MVATLDHVGQTSMFRPKNSLSNSKNKRVWFSGAREPIQMKFVQMVQPLSQCIKITVKNFGCYRQEEIARFTMSPVGHFDKQEKQAQPYS